MLDFGIPILLLFEYKGRHFLRDFFYFFLLARNRGIRSSFSPSLSHHCSPDLFFRIFSLTLLFFPCRERF
jgi:hypothetical protein